MPCSTVALILPYSASAAAESFRSGNSACASTGAINLHAVIALTHIPHIGRKQLAWLSTPCGTLKRLCFSCVMHQELLYKSSTGMVVSTGTLTPSHVITEPGALHVSDLQAMSCSILHRGKGNPPPLAHRNQSQSSTCALDAETPPQKHATNSQMAKIFKIRLNLYGTAWGIYITKCWSPHCSSSAPEVEPFKLGQRQQ